MALIYNKKFLLTLLINLQVTATKTWLDHTEGHRRFALIEEFSRETVGAALLNRTSKAYAGA